MQVWKLAATKRTQEAAGNMGKAHPDHIDAKSSRARRLMREVVRLKEVVEPIEERFAVRQGRLSC